MFIINPPEKATIYRTWRTRARKRLCDIFHDICENGASTHWFTNEILQALRAHWDSPAFKEKQVKAQMSRGSAHGGSLYTGGSTTIEGTRLRMVNIIFFSFSFSIFILNIIYIIILKCRRRQWEGHQFWGASLGDSHPEEEQALVGWYAVKDHIRKYL